MSTNAITLDKVSKHYTLHHYKPTLIEQLFRNKTPKPFTAIDNLNLEIKRGEKIGIIGPNASGKTTLLKIIAGITSPDSGSVHTQGKLVSLIDLEAGFHPDLSGRDNIFLNGLIIGMTKSQIASQISSIIDFADIGPFIDAPLYTYSQGMKLRLGFSVAAYSNPDILVLDEVASAGDEDFQYKSQQKIEQLFQQKKTILVVSHWLDFLRKYARRIIYLEQGKIVEDGKIDIIDRYSNKKFIHY